MKNEAVKFENVTIWLTGANGETFEYHQNNEYCNTSKEDIINIFKLETLGMATELDGYDMTKMNSFNTYNHGAPYTFCGVAPEDIYDGVALVNIHLGGDARINYSNEIYICEEVDALFMQNTSLEIELSNGDVYRLDCDNGEAYFDFDNLDVYSIDFDKNLTPEQIEEITAKCDKVK